MIEYKNTYKDFFCYALDENVPSEISGGVAVDIHHIKFKSRGGNDRIENLMALTRGEHLLAHTGHYTEDWLRMQHHNFIKENRPDYTIKINGDERMDENK